MAGRVDDHVPLDYAEIQIFPSQNRYEVSICSKGKIEDLEDGVLELLSPHLPSVKELYSKGSNATFKLSPPSSGVTWFTKSTLNRFLQIVRSSNVVHTASSIKDEMSQLEEAGKFHVSLYGQPPKVANASSDTSKNELLRAMDLRLTALRTELTTAFCNAASAICSSKETANLANFSKHFGGVDLRNSLHKLSELNRESHSKRSVASSSRNDANEIMDRDANAIKPIPSDTPVVYGVSPAKAAQVERQSSTDGSEESESSVHSDEDRPSAERSRTLARSATPRRSASPMRRVQIGRGGSRRAAALTIKSLNYYPVRDKSFPYRDGAGNSSEEEEGSEQPVKKPEGHVRRMSVQDAISLFENKQKDRADDSQLRKSLSALSITANKSVLRRWSSGVGETSAPCEPEPEDVVVATTGPSDVANYESVRYSAEEKSELETATAGQEVIEIPENCANSERFEKGSCDPIEIQDIKKTGDGEDDAKKSTATTEWNRAKEAELNQMLMQMMEAKPVKYTKAHPSRKQSLPSGQRGGFYDHYKEKRDEKLRGENIKKKAEKEAQFKAMQQILEDRKAEMASKNSTDAEKKPAARKSQKMLRNSPRPSNPKRETPPKPTVPKKISPRASPLPPTRKSWPSTPPSRAAAVSPAKTPVPNSSANTTPTRRKTQQTQSLPRAAPKVERPQQPPRSAKEPLAESGKNTKKPQQAPSKNGSKVTKTKQVASAEDISDVVPAKPGLYSKAAKKSTVVPVEPKPFLRKGSRTAASVNPGTNKRNSPEPEEPRKSSGGDLAEAVGPEPASQDRGDVTSAPNSDAAAAGSEDPVNTHQESGGTENPDSGPAEEKKSTEDSSTEIQAEEEPAIISPSAWEEIEEQPGVDDRPPPGNTAAAGPVSPRVRHSLSQMLLEESNEPDIVEWGNAENPPAVMYQKDVPKGFKRLLKFARKSKGDAANSSGFSSPSVFSEGEDDSDGFMKKGALSAKIHGQQKTSLCEGYDSRELLYPAKSNVGKSNGRSNLQKLQESSDSAAVPSTKATRSFFSLSAFRGGAK